MTKYPPRDIVYVEQPTYSSECGQACLAMVAGISKADAITLCGRENGTSTRDVMNTLDKLNIGHGMLTRCNHKRALPKRALLIVHYNRVKLRHWCVLWKGWYFDPWWGISPSLQPRGDAYSTSYIRIDRKVR